MHVNLVLLVVATTAPMAAMTAARPKFFLFGDSLTQRSFDFGGWGASLAHKYSRKADVVLRGYSGYNTRWALQILDSVFPANLEPVPHLVTLFWGANDAAIPDRHSARQHVPVEEYVTNVAKMIKRLRALGVRHIVLITPPPVAEEGRIKHNQATGGEADAEPERTNEFTARYAGACRALGAREGVPVLDLWTLLQEYIGWQATFLSDGLHFTPDGNQAVFTHLLALIEKEVPDLREPAMLWDFPQHDEICEADPASSFQPPK